MRNVGHQVSCTGTARVPALLLSARPRLLCYASPVSHRPLVGLIVAGVAGWSNQPVNDDACIAETKLMPLTIEVTDRTARKICRTRHQITTDRILSSLSHRTENDRLNTTRGYAVTSMDYYCLLTEKWASAQEFPLKATAAEIPIGWKFGGNGLTYPKCLVLCVSLLQCSEALKRVDRSSGLWFSVTVSLTWLLVITYAYYAAAWAFIYICIITLFFKWSYLGLFMHMYVIHMHKTLGFPWQKCHRNLPKRFIWVRKRNLTGRSLTDRQQEIGGKCQITVCY